MPHGAADAARVFSALVNTDVTQLTTQDHAHTLKTIIFYNLSLVLSILHNKI